MFPAETLSQKNRIGFFVGQSTYFCTLFFCLITAFVCLITAPVYGAVDAAHFWLSTSNVATPGPEVVIDSPTAGVSDTLYVWGRPTAGRQLRAVSLNLLADSTGVDFVDGGYTLYNDVDLSIDRFQFKQDSLAVPPLESEYTAVEVGAGSTDGLYGINAFTLIDSPTLRGIGPVCSAGEIGCVTAGDGEPAWLIAEIDIAAITAGETVDLYLQVGDLGLVEWTIATGDYDFQGEVDIADHAIWTATFGSSTFLAADGNDDGIVNAADYTVWRDHLGDSGTVLTIGDTDVRFGSDKAAGVEPVHNALLDFGVNLPGDDPDATITISAPAVSVPEPASLLLIALGTVALGLRRATKSQSARRG